MRILTTVHGYEGDGHQIEELMPMYEHHGFEIVIVSPEDSKIERFPHLRNVYAGKRAYIGQDSWDRQHLQLKALLQFPFDWVLMNDSDSFVLTPVLPDYLTADPNIVYSNEVTDFRVPGEIWPGPPPVGPWPLDYHAGYPLIAMQPPYFASRQAIERMVAATEGMVACPITPFIDWWFVPACHKAGLGHLPFQTGASCETVTPHGLAVMSERITKYGATFIHSVKSGEVMRHLKNLHDTRA